LVISLGLVGGQEAKLLFDLLAAHFFSIHFYPS
jgi:hypothetical protein